VKKLEEEGQLSEAGERSDAVWGAWRNPRRETKQQHYYGKERGGGVDQRINRPLLALVRENSHAFEPRTTR